MLTILTSRQEAKDLAGKIHKWRQENIPRYNATSWANENLKDEEFDKLYKHEKDALWQVPLASEDMGLKVKTVESLPEEWRMEAKPELIE